MSVPTASVGSAVGFALMPTGTARERTPWHAVQKAAWEALTEAARSPAAYGLASRFRRTRGTPQLLPGPHRARCQEAGRLFAYRRSPTGGNGSVHAQDLSRSARVVSSVLR